MKNKEIVFDFNEETDNVESKSLFEEKSGQLKFAASEGKKELMMQSPWKVLIVDDQEEVHQVTEMVLDDFEFQNRGIKFISAYSAAEAKDIIATEDDIAVILLDVVMEEDNSGLQLVKYIRDELENNLVRIILRTGQPGEAPEKEVIKAYDINDYKEKTELTSKKLYTTLMTSLRSYQGLKQLAETTAAKNRIESELNVATKIQSNMLPKDFPPFPERKEIDIFASMTPARQVGGDLYDFFFITEDKLCFVIGDASGKGVPAALFMAIAKKLIKTEALKNIPLERILYNVNNALCRENGELLFVTAFIGILNVKTGKLEFINAGHNAPLIGRDKYWEFLDVKSNFILGITSDYNYQKQSLYLTSDDILFLYTDGVTEAMNEQEEQYSYLRLKKVLEGIKTTDVSIIENKIKGDIEEFVAENSQSDDLTMIVLKFNGT
ncbi:PP2C family protein-serine/threonine phosphatase [Halanaerobacter jeridensis]|uniref:Stage 0 sporulation protein A homolog n=1 Tax=Halanaerobacter jeridensis TaxID=706427 RepID=A0A939BMJ7_9FIRM|nr:SpoIIE family protein phosphatase [Halanaerobacter jeridensis]MBM7556730.1 serine phosphatase RsbU (regulator of sigma subunit) [Halanaerobacter jeridensis]